MGYSWSVPGWFWERRSPHGVGERDAEQDGGRGADQAVQGLDYALMQGVFLVITLTVLAANFVMDLIYGFIDPRVRHNG